MSITEILKDGWIIVIPKSQYRNAIKIVKRIKWGRPISRETKDYVSNMFCNISLFKYKNEYYLAFSSGRSSFLVIKHNEKLRKVLSKKLLEFFENGVLRRWGNVK